jgi:hypothetical protein
LWEGSGRECRQESLRLLTVVECLLVLHRWDVAEWLQEAVVIEPPDPFERGELHVFEARRNEMKQLTEYSLIAPEGVNAMRDLERYVREIGL